MKNNFVDFECKKCKTIVSDIEYSDDNYSLRCPYCNTFITNVRILNNNKEYFDTKDFYYQNIMFAKIVKYRKNFVKGKLQQNYNIISDDKKIYTIIPTNYASNNLNTEGIYELEFQPYDCMYFLTKKI